MSRQVREIQKDREMVRVVFSKGGNIDKTTRVNP
jgi:hypothetical protein